jgi:hypothetical protein
MATVGQNAYTLLDWSKRQDPNGAQSKVAEILANQNPVMEDALMVEGNGPTSHRTTVRTGLPGVTWRQLNYGVQPTKSIVRQVDDTMGMLEAYAEIDKALADMNGNTAEFRLSEDKAFLEAMAQSFESTFFYGNTAIDPEKFMGLAPRYTSIGTNPLVSSYNVISAGGAGSDNTSLWLVTWGDTTCHLTFPKGKSGGLQHRDLGEDTLIDAAGGKYQGYRSHYKLDVGCVVRDWRYVARLANIDISDLATAGLGTDTSAKLIPLMIRLMHRIPNLKAGKAVFYANRDVLAALDIMAQAKTNVYLTQKEFAGELVTMFRGIPIKRADAILNTESVVS